jgi:uncharacterized Zn-binding protein involved in type VI secretion
MPGPSARALGTDKVLSNTGSGYLCGFPMMTATGVPTQATVFSNSVLCVRTGDLTAPHPFAGCGPDTLPCIGSAVKTFIVGMPGATIGDTYSGDNTILAGSPTVFMF